jgi:ATP synthase protein I
MSEPRDDDRPENGSEGRKATAELEARIALARGRRPVETGPEPTHRQAASGLSIAWRLMSEFVAAIIVGGGLGYLLDMFLPTRPWGMIVLLLLGFAAGVLNVVRAAKELNAATAVAPGTPLVPDDDNDD